MVNVMQIRPSINVADEVYAQNLKRQPEVTEKSWRCDVNASWSIPDSWNLLASRLAQWLYV